MNESQEKKWNELTLIGLCITPFVMTILAPTFLGPLNGVSLALIFIFWCCLCLWIAWEGETT